MKTERDTRTELKEEGKLGWFWHKTAKIPTTWRWARGDKGGGGRGIRGTLLTKNFNAACVQVNSCIMLTADDTKTQCTQQDEWRSVRRSQWMSRTSFSSIQFSYENVTKSLTANRRWNLSELQLSRLHLSVGQQYASTYEFNQKYRLSLMYIS